MTALIRMVAGLALWLAATSPAQAAVTITFWSHELGNSFPHAFFTLSGVPDMGGPPVDTNYGFTARKISPAMLFGSVAGRLDIAKPGYIRTSDAQFSVTLTDGQYATILALAAGWSADGGDSRYSIEDRNCIHFVKEAARRIGLTDLDQPGLMKRPRSYLKAVAAANAGRITPVSLHGKAHLATLEPLVPASRFPSPIVTVTTPPPVPVPGVTF